MRLQVLNQIAQPTTNPQDETKMTTVAANPPDGQEGQNPMDSIVLHTLYNLTLSQRIGLLTWMFEVSSATSTTASTVTN